MSPKPVLLSALPCLFLLGLAPAPGPPAPSAARQETTSLAIPEAGVSILRPRTWIEGGVRGSGILLSYIGAPDGLPAFAVQHDPESRMPDESSDQQIDDAVEGLFQAIIEGREGYVVIDAGWREINGLRVHDSLSTYPSVAGTLEVRRLILVRDNSPFIFSWTARAEQWESLETLISMCVDSLVPLRPGRDVAN